MTASLAGRIRGLGEQTLWAPALAAGAVVLYCYDPRQIGMPCPFYRCTGLYCPGCGTMRAAHSLLHGDVAAAFGYNPFMVLSLPLLGAIVWDRVTRGTSAEWPALTRRLRRIMPTLPWIVVVYWILRNLPFYPFSLLAP